MNNKELKRSCDISKAIKEAQEFYKNNGFIDFTRFAKYFNNIKFESNDHRIHSLTNWYLLLFSKESQNV